MVPAKRAVYLVLDTVLRTGSYQLSSFDMDSGAIATNQLADCLPPQLSRPLLLQPRKKLAKKVAIANHTGSCLREYGSSELESSPVR